MEPTGDFPVSVKRLSNWSHGLATGEGTANTRRLSGGQPLVVELMTTAKPTVSKAPSRGRPGPTRAMSGNSKVIRSFNCASFTGIY